MSDAPEDKLRKLIETIKKTGLAANDADAEQIAKRMLTMRDVEKDKIGDESSGPDH